MTGLHRTRWLFRLCTWFVPLFACAPALADPALWVVKSPTATLFLFGTIHVLPGNVAWHYPALDAALAASDVLYVEQHDDSPATKQSLIRKYGFEPWHTTTRPFESGPYPTLLYIVSSSFLSDQLAPPDRTRLDEAAQSARLPGGTTTLENMKPWMAAMTLTKTIEIRAGYEPQFDVGKVLERGFVADGKAIKGFETAQQQVESMAALPYPVQLRMLHNILAGKGQISIETLARIWQSGDEAAMAAAVNGQLRKYYPALYAAMLVNRNRVWANRIATLLAGHATIFVAVGAGHLVGPDSVQAQLQKLGIHAERVH